MVIPQLHAYLGKSISQICQNGYTKPLRPLRPASLTTCLVFITGASHVNLTGKRMSNVPRRHVGVNLGGSIWHYSNKDTAGLTKRVASGGRARDLSRLSRAEEAARAARNAGRLATGLKAVAYLFFLWSAYGAIDTLDKDLHGH